MNTNLYLIRHAEQLSWAVDRTQPVNVIEDRLSERGLEQAHRLADRFARSIKIDALYASPLLRAMQTANAIREVTHIPVQVDENLAEFKMNTAQALTPEENERVWMRSRADVHTPALPGCETMLDFHARAAQTIESIVQAQLDQAVAIVTHGGLIEQSFFHFLGIPFEGNLKSFIQIDHTSIFEWRLFQRQHMSGWLLVKANDTRHLDGLL
jgi:broad specificity phosphatase PhoE